jgi:hypothetical protein
MSKENKTLQQDFTLLVVFALAILLVVARAWYYLVASRRWAAPKCPVCGGPLRRTRRRPVDRVLSWFVPVGRYCCCECPWVGLRVRPWRER